MSSKSKAQSAPTRPTILVVDDEPQMLELATDVVGREIDCRLITASGVREANHLIETEAVDVLLADVHLPDGNGLSLLSALQLHRPTAGAVVITGHPTVAKAIDAIRAGVLDFLAKPFTSDQLIERVRVAVSQQADGAYRAGRISRLKREVKKLRQSRKVVTQKVDLLCNDLVAAYGEISKQVEEVRTQEAFRKMCAEAKDLEQLLCHAMDWILKEAGHCNVAIWLASEDREYELGAYMKYTVAGTTELTEALKVGLVLQTVKRGFIRIDSPDERKILTETEDDLLDGQTVIGSVCTYLGEGLGTVLCFRDSRSPFTDTDAEMLKVISPIFAVALASIVKRGHDDDESDHFGNAGPTDESHNGLDDTLPSADEDGNDKPARPEKPKRPKKRSDSSDADWWKRGEAPPF